MGADFILFISRQTPAVGDTLFWRLTRSFEAPKKASHVFHGVLGAGLLSLPTRKSSSPRVKHNSGISFFKELALVNLCFHNRK